MFLPLEPPRQPPEPEAVDPCYPSPCGPNAECNHKNDDDDNSHPIAICSCPLRFPKGDPYVGCRPECVNNADCPQKQACGSQQKCIDPCPGLCGHSAVCRVSNHNPLCTCNAGFTGSPYQGCRIIPRKYAIRTECLLKCIGIVFLWHMNAGELCIFPQR